MKKKEITSLPAEIEKKDQLSPITFDELSSVLGGKSGVNKGSNKPSGSGGGFICWC